PRAAQVDERNRAGPVRDRAESRRSDAVPAHATRGTVHCKVTVDGASDRSDRRLVSAGCAGRWDAHRYAWAPWPVAGGDQRRAGDAGNAADRRRAAAASTALRSGRCVPLDDIPWDRHLSVSGAWPRNESRWKEHTYTRWTDAARGSWRSR